MIESITPTEPRPLAPATDAPAPRVDPGAAWSGRQEVPTSGVAGGPELTMLGPTASGPTLTMLGTAASGAGCADASCALPTADGPC